MNIPKSPNDMPGDLPPNWLRNTIVTLNNFDSVSIYWENDNRISNMTGEPEGEWEVNISANGKRFDSVHEDIEHALWFAVTCAENHQSESWQKHESARKTALAKLTPEERKLLRI